MIAADDAAIAAIDMSRSELTPPLSPTAGRRRQLISASHYAIFILRHFAEPAPPPFIASCQPLSAIAIADIDAISVLI